MCERIPAVPNDGHKYIVPSPVASFGRRTDLPVPEGENTRR
jgi:hypothetical protein